MAFSISTQIHINATPNQVWQVLTDVDLYPEWNPFVKSLEGVVKEGSYIKVSLPGMKIKPKVINFEKNNLFKWSGNLLFKGIFDGVHSFRLVDNDDGTTTFIHSEEFKGFLIPLLKKKLSTEIKDGFEEMNRALKQRVEKFS